MPILRLAYTTQFLVALIAVFFVWSEIGGQTHLEIMPWWWKAALGAGLAFSCVKATAAAVGGSSAWNAGSLKWLGITLVFVAACGMATYYVHMYGEEDEDQPDEQTSGVAKIIGPQSTSTPLAATTETLEVAPFLPAALSRRAIRPAATLLTPLR